MTTPEDASQAVPDAFAEFVTNWAPPLDHGARYKFDREFAAACLAAIAQDRAARAQADPVAWMTPDEMSVMTPDEKANMRTGDPEDDGFADRHDVPLVRATSARAQGAGEAETFRIALHEWAVQGWRDEVQNRPLVNIHRKRLDDFWRKAIRKAGGDPDALLGPDHDAIIESMRANVAPTTPPCS